MSIIRMWCLTPRRQAVAGKRRLILLVHPTIYAVVSS
jgi:hypothetical protein